MRYSRPPSGTLPTGFSHRPIEAILLAPLISFAPLSSLATVLVPRSQPLSNRFNYAFFILNILLKPEAFLMTKMKGVDLRGSRLSLIGSSDAEGSGDDDEGKGNGKKKMMSSAALGKYDIKKTKRIPLKFLEEEDYLSLHVQAIRNEFNKRRMAEKGIGVGDDDSILSPKSAISACLEGNDALLKAKTGTGKSAAFLLKFLTYKLRTFLIRNGLSILFKEGPIAYKTYYLRQMKIWNTSPGKQRQLSKMAVYIRRKYRNKQLSSSIYLSEAEPFLEQYAPNEEVWSESNPFSLDALAVFIYRVVNRVNHPVVKVFYYNTFLGALRMLLKPLECLGVAYPSYNTKQNHNRGLFCMKWLSGYIILDKLKLCRSISYAAVAAPADQTSRRKLAPFQVPLLLGIGEEDTSLTKATESGDTDLVYLVLFHIWQKRLALELFGMIQARPIARDLFIRDSRYHILAWLKALEETRLKQK
ncbi:hypothetical protein Lser_V15G34851 [Lactuca serriola]